MKICNHFVLGAFAALPMSTVSIAGSLIFFTVSILIDIDHFIFFSIHEKQMIFSINKFIKSYGCWQYFGPRILIFHNYEILISTGIIGLLTGNMVINYMFWGIGFHLGCDQLGSYRQFRYLRIKSLVMDSIRYHLYTEARQSGNEMDMIIALRNDWYNHLRKNLSENKLKSALAKSEILKKFPQIPLEKKDKPGWFSPLL